MFCSNCGTKAGGNFCAACGAKIQDLATGKPQPSQPLGDWTDEIVYETLLQHAEVRERIANAATRCPNRISGDDVLALFDAIQPSPVPVGKLVKGLVPVLDRLGINTGKSSEISLQAAAGQTLAALLCALAGQGYKVQQVDQLADGCVLTASIPSTFWTHAGELVVGIQRRQQSIQIQAATKIAGQLYDWGKSNSILRELFDDIRSELSLDGGSASTSRNVA